MKELFQDIVRKMDAGQDLVLVTIIAGSGSTPRGAGARMWVSADRSQGGTIGGGNVEYQAFLKAQDVLETRNSQVSGYNLGSDEVANIGMVCGGKVVVYFQYVSARDKKTKAFFERCISQCSQAEGSWIIMDITDEVVWKMGIYTESGGLEGIEIEDYRTLLKNHAFRAQVGDKLYYAEPLVQTGTVYVFGGGHVAQELVPVLNHLGFRCVVLEDRELFVQEQLFPDAAERILCDFKEIEQYIQVTDRDYVVIMTRGHQHDYEIQSQMLAKKPFYIGVMGSRRKIKFVTEKLIADGYTEAEIAVSHMPIGINIGGETPAEIAISIAGELIQARAQRRYRKD